MSEDLVTLDNVSKEMLKDLFDAAFLETSYDSEGDLRVREKVNCIVFVYKDLRKVQFAAYFGFKPNVPEIDKLRCVNNINNDFNIVRASVLNNETLKFSYDIALDGGILKYFEDTGGKHYHGSCFVFDERVALRPVDPEGLQLRVEGARGVPGRPEPEQRGQAAAQQEPVAVDHDRRSAIRAHHSATHLLHEALRRRLGTHVAQKGSLNAPDRLRFDVSQPTPMTEEDLHWVEAEVNARIRENASVSTRLMSPEEAVAKGAIALFGEKYGDEVRVVSMGTRPGSGIGAGG